MREASRQDQRIARPQRDRRATARQVKADAPAHDAQHRLVSVLMDGVGVVHAVTPLVRLQALIRVEAADDLVRQDWSVPAPNDGRGITHTVSRGWGEGPQVARVSCKRRCIDHRLDSEQERRTSMLRFPTAPSVVLREATRRWRQPASTRDTDGERCPTSQRGGGHPAVWRDGWVVRRNGIGRSSSG